MMILDYPRIRIPKGETNPFTLFEASYYDKDSPATYGPVFIQAVKGTAPRPGTCGTSVDEERSY